MERDIQASTRLRGPLPRVREVLADVPECLVTDAGDAPRRDEVPTTLSTSLGAGAVVQHDVVARLGPVRFSENDVVVGLSWRPAGHERVLPDFEGRLVVDGDPDGHTRLSLEGVYQVPLGPVGRFGDSLVGRRVARHSVSELLGKMAERLDREVHRRLATAPTLPAPYPVDLRERPGPEIHIG